MGPPGYCLGATSALATFGAVVAFHFVATGQVRIPEEWFGTFAITGSVTCLESSAG